MWIQISSGRGPEECSLATALFLEKVLIPCLESSKVKYNILSKDKGKRKDTLKSVLLAIELTDGNVVENLKEFNGVMVWIQKSPYRQNHNRKNWFFSAAVYEEPQLDTFDKKDIRVETTHSSGPGGQNVNKVETAVRMVHIPTGITVFASEERSQGMNRKLALARLRTLLEEGNTRKCDAKKNELWNQHNTLERGDPVKSFKGNKFIEI